MPPPNPLCWFSRSPPQLWVLERVTGRKAVSMPSHLWLSEASLRFHPPCSCQCWLSLGPCVSLQETLKDATFSLGLVTAPCPWAQGHFPSFHQNSYAARCPGKWVNVLDKLTFCQFLAGISQLQTQHWSLTFDLAASNQKIMLCFPSCSLRVTGPAGLWGFKCIWPP